jgi:catechol 2,3-dioxygenase-like lactoylglutathione lyase family enzyme
LIQKPIRRFFDVFDHLGFPVRDLARTRAFYAAALAPLGIGVAMEVPGAVAFGKSGRPQLWFGTNKAPAGGFHLAFSAANRDEVREFYAAALAGGATDNGAPGLPPHYHPNYYGAFVLDPDGHNVEAVCHKAED